MSTEDQHRTEANQQFQANTIATTQSIYLAEPVRLITVKHYHKYCNSYRFMRLNDASYMQAAQPPMSLRGGHEDQHNTDSDVSLLLAAV